MSLTYSVGSAVSASALNGPECEPSRSARSIHSADESSPSIGQMSLFTTTCEPSPQRELGRAVNLSMLSAAASLVRISHSPEKVRASAASVAAFGRSTPELLARFDPNTSSWRTSQLCLDGALSEFSETWPRSGLMRSGIAYRLPPLVRLIGEIECGSWPTPTPTGMERSSKHTRPFGSLKDAAKMFPTPTSTDWKRVPMTEYYAWKPITHGTPDTCAQAACRATNGGSLNPTWVEWLMGFPLGWTDCSPSAMPSSRKSRKSLEGQ